MKSPAKITNQWVRQKKYSFWFKEETTSTNDIARQEAFDVKYNFKMYFTNHQTHGRGSHSRVWKDTGNSFLSSWSYRITHSPQHIMSPLVGLALFNSCQLVWPHLTWSLKAPNDLFLMNKKVAGLLIESILQGEEHRLIIGLGMNVNDHPKDIKEATHITSDLGTGAPIGQKKWYLLLDQLKLQFEEALKKGATSQISKEDRTILLTALNANPLKPKLFLKITDQGDLVTETKTIAWSSL